MALDLPLCPSANALPGGAPDTFPAWAARSPHDQSTRSGGSSAARSHACTMIASFCRCNWLSLAATAFALTRCSHQPVGTVIPARPASLPPGWSPTLSPRSFLLSRVTIADYPNYHGLLLLRAPPGTTAGQHRNAVCVVGPVARNWSCPPEKPRAEF